MLILLSYLITITSWKGNIVLLISFVNWRDWCRLFREDIKLFLSIKKFCQDNEKNGNLCLSGLISIISKSVLRFHNFIALIFIISPFYNLQISNEIEKRGLEKINVFKNVNQSTWTIIPRYRYSISTPTATITNNEILKMRIITIGRKY